MASDKFLALSLVLSLSKDEGRLVPIPAINQRAFPPDRMML